MPPRATDQPDTMEILAPYLDEIESHLEQTMGRAARSRLPANLEEAMRYAVLGGGKRLRPLLSVLSCRAVGGEWRSALPAGIATELIHAFSLVHDDLPAMDDDDLRRGRPTLHVQFGEAMAILAGDALESLAFELLCNEAYEPATVALLVRELADATMRMIAGQVYDTLGGVDGKLPRHRQIETIHRNKTGALIRAACRMGAMVGGADRSELDRISEFGEATGLMFQIVDDLLDVTQSAEHIGKATGKDSEAGKMTFPGVIGVEGSIEEISHLRDRALCAIQPLGETAAHLGRLCAFLAVRTK